MKRFTSWGDGWNCWFWNELGNGKSQLNHFKALRTVPTGERLFKVSASLLEDDVNEAPSELNSATVKMSFKILGLSILYNRRFFWMLIHSMKLSIEGAPIWCPIRFEDEGYSWETQNISGQSLRWACCEFGTKAGISLEWLSLWRGEKSLNPWK